MKVTNEVVQREIAGEHILIPTGAAALKVHGMITLTESAVLLWNRLQSDCTEEDLINVILNEYEIDRATAQADVQGFLSKLEAIGVLEKDEG